MRICQLQNMSISILIKSFCIIVLFGCAETPVVQKVQIKNDKIIAPKWYKVPQRFSSTEFNETISTHPFFDIDSKTDDFNKIPYFVSTGEGSKFQYALDMYSGKLYMERAFCKQNDIWKNYNDDLSVPNFTQGYVPNVYDENQKPQKIILFSNKEFVEPFKEQPDHYEESKILGSVIIESCESLPCDLRSNWKPTQILVGVSPSDPEYNSLETFTSLKKKVNWDYARAMLNNMNGYNNIGGKLTPAHRVLKELSLKDSIEYFKTKSHPLNAEASEKLSKWKTGCMDLYDSIWDETLKIRKMPHGQADTFFKYFKDFYAKNSNEFYQCQKLVRPANVLDNTKRLWFFAYLQAFTLLDKNGFSYACMEHTWSMGYKTEMERCRVTNFERAFEQSINGMSLMRTQVNSQYRFVEYDGASGGSHQKIYGWIFDKPQVYGCKNQVESSNQMMSPIFPQDVVWENFKQDEASVVR